MTTEIINVLKLMAEGKIKEGTKLEFDGFEYEFSEGHFENGVGDWLEDIHEISASFLNLEVELIEPKEKKYLIKLNVKWLKSSFSHVNYVNRGTDQYILIGDDENLLRYQTQFTKKELKSIKPVKEFLDDMQGKYKLVEVEEEE